MTGTPVGGCPHIFHVKFGRSSDVWVCEHGTGYPDLCEECQSKQMDSTTRTFEQKRP